MNQTKVIAEGERPPLGFLVLDDGTTLVLAADLVIGREPQNSPSVRTGASPVRLSDTAGRLSRAHAEIRLIEWDVAVVDLNSKNGTFVKPPGHDQWLRLAPRQPHVLVAGAEVQLGGRTITFESAHAHL
jgi:pSer/pThr/pTyr-binding forkhead associated (FHA) protein